MRNVQLHMIALFLFILGTTSCVKESSKTKLKKQYIWTQILYYSAEDRTDVTSNLHSAWYDLTLDGSASIELNGTTLTQSTENEIDYISTQSGSVDPSLLNYTTNDGQSISQSIDLAPVIIFDSIPDTIKVGESFSIDWLGSVVGVEESVTLSVIQGTHILNSRTSVAGDGAITFAASDWGTDDDFTAGEVTIRLERKLRHRYENDVIDFIQANSSYITDATTNLSL